MAFEFTQELINGARYTQEHYGVPASMTLGQMMLESSGSYPGGMSGLAYKAKNLFGIKAGSSWTGKTINMSTGEYGSGGKYTTDADFRVYDSFSDSIIDHAKLFQTERYAKNLKGVTNYKDYAYGIQKSGYATDPGYASKLIRLIEENGLAKYDSGSFGTGTVPDNLGTSSGADDGMIESIGKMLVLGAIIITLLILGVLFLMGAFDVKPVRQVKKAVKKSD